MAETDLRGGVSACAAGLLDERLNRALSLPAGVFLPFLTMLHPASPSQRLNRALSLPAGIFLPFLTTLHPARMHPFNMPAWKVLGLPACTCQAFPTNYHVTVETSRIMVLRPRWHFWTPGRPFDV